MSSLRRLSAREVIAALGRLGFRRISQRGSHVKLARTGPQGERQVLTVPDHTELDLGTLRALARQTGRFVNAEDIRRIFYRD